MGYLLLDRKIGNSVCRAEVIKDKIKLSINGIVIKEVDAWEYNRKDLELILYMESTNIGSGVTVAPRRLSSYYMDSVVL